jgi:Zn-dependent membrane protease YugP
MAGYYLIGIVMFLISMGIQWRLKSKFAQYSTMSLGNGMSGKEVAEKMLQDHGIQDVKVIHVAGQLTDHYNPLNKTVNLSDDVYAGRSAAAAAVAAHECGHAVQHASSYGPLALRSKLVPLQNVSGMVLNIVIFASMFIGFGLANTGLSQTMLLVIIACYAVITAFALITLPVEFDASNRALAWMKDRGVVSVSEYAGAKDALKWAAMTYVAAAAGSLVNLLYFVLRFIGNTRD